MQPAARNNQISGGLIVATLGSPTAQTLTRSSLRERDSWNYRVSWELIHATRGAKRCNLPCPYPPASRPDVVSQATSFHIHPLRLPRRLMRRPSGNLPLAGCGRTHDVVGCSIPSRPDIWQPPGRPATSRPASRPHGTPHNVLCPASDPPPAGTGRAAEKWPAGREFASQPAGTE